MSVRAGAYPAFLFGLTDAKNRGFRAFDLPWEAAVLSVDSYGDVYKRQVWGSEGEDGSNDTSIIATITLSEEDVAEKLGEDYTEEQARDLVWEEVDKVNEELPYYKKIKQIRIRKEDFEKTTGKKIKRFVDANKEETL